MIACLQVLPPKFASERVVGGDAVDVAVMDEAPTASVATLARQLRTQRLLEQR